MEWRSSNNNNEINQQAEDLLAHAKAQKDIAEANCEGEATLTAANVLAAEILASPTSCCKCYCPSRTKLVLGMLNDEKDQAWLTL